MGTTFEGSYEVERLKEQLAAKEAEVAMLREFVKLLRDIIPLSAVGNMTVQDALAATSDDWLRKHDAEPTFTAQQVADACMEAEIPDSKCEILLLALRA